MKKGSCSRCAAETPTYTFEKERTFVGVLKVKTSSVTQHTVNNIFTFIEGGGRNATMNGGDEEYKLCENCWSDFVGYFMQNRDKPVIPTNKEEL